MNNFEDNLNSALQQLQQGRDKAEILAQFPGQNHDLSDALELSQILFSMPKNEVPQPTMQRKYALSPVKKLWLHSIHLSRFSVVGSSLLLVLILSGSTIYAAEQSVPGQTLFQLKKAAEHFQVQMAGNQVARANLQVEIAQKRLTEAQGILNNPNSNPAQQQAAINELLSETQSTINAVSAAAKDNALSQSDHPIVASLEKLTSQQQALVKQQAKANPNLSADSKNALAASQNNAEQVAQIQQYIAAASAEQNLTTLAANPNSVSIVGTINAKSGDNLITVEKTQFYLNSQTQIQDNSGNNLNNQSLNVNQRVSVLGFKSDGHIVAQQVIVLGSNSGQVEAASTTAPSISTTTPQNFGSSTPGNWQTKIDAKNSAQEDASSTQPEDPNTVTGSFIIESPQPQSGLNN